MTSADQDIINTLTFLRATNFNITTLEKKLILLKKKISSKEFNLVINGSENRTIGYFNYRIIKMNNGDTVWCLKSQIEYEIDVKKNNKLITLYNNLKMVYI